MGLYGTCDPHHDIVVPANARCSSASGHNLRTRIDGRRRSMILDATHIKGTAQYDTTPPMPALATNEPPDPDCTMWRAGTRRYSPATTTHSEKPFLLKFPLAQQHSRQKIFQCE